MNRILDRVYLRMLENCRDRAYRNFYKQVEGNYKWYEKLWSKLTKMSLEDFRELEIASYTFGCIYWDSELLYAECRYFEKYVANA